MRRCVVRSCWWRSKGCTAESTALVCRACLAWVGVGGMSGPAASPAPRPGPAAGGCAFSRMRGSASRAMRLHPCKPIAIHGNTWSRHPTHTAPSTVGWCASERSTAGRIGRLTFLLDQSSSFHAGVEPTVGRLLLTRFYAVDSSHRRRRPFRARAVGPCRDRRAPWMAPVEPPGMGLRRVPAGSDRPRPRRTTNSQRLSDTPHPPAPCRGTPGTTTPYSPGSPAAGSPARPD